MTSPKLVVTDAPEVIEEIGRYLADKEYIAYDTETTGLTKRDEIIGFSVCAEEDLAYYVVLARWSVAENKLIYSSPETKDAATSLIASLKGKQLIMHNSVFDCYMTEANFKISLIDSLHTDTMVLAHLLNENRRIGLKELAKEYFGESSITEAAEMKASVLANGGLLTKACYEMYKADAELLGKYGSKDTILTYKLFHILVPELFEQKLDKFFYEDESMPLLKGPTYDLNTTGLMVDPKRLSDLKRQLEAECLEAKAFVMQEIASKIKDKYPGTNKKNTFNIGSNQQMAWLMFGAFELEFGTLTKSGKEVCRAMGEPLPYTFKAKRDFIELCLQAEGKTYKGESIFNGKKKSAIKFKAPWAYIQCDKRTLQKHAVKYKWIERLLEFKRKDKILKTYIKGIQERTHYGVINPSFLQTGTTSGRYSSRNINFQNLPRDDKRIKECIIARPGKVFVGADYSQLEPRVFAYVSGDKALMAAFNGTDDFYSVIGMRVFGVYDCTPQKEGSPDAFGVKYKKLRDLSKVIALASTYGATAHQLAPTTGKSIEDTAEDINTYFEEFPDVAKMMTDAHKSAKKHGQVTNIFGRPRRMPEAKRIDKLYGKLSHAKLPYEARNILNLAVNHRIQSSGASIVNRASIRFLLDCKEAGIDAKLCCQVHDSLIAECNQEDAESVSILLENAMVETTKLDGINLEAIPKIGKNFAEV